ncbi:hypothetical protein KM043_015786 [Ampulex compressa]|nr:hypothetical protein KM043_015786 [Ampulex compressa]
MPDSSLTWMQMRRRKELEHGKHFFWYLECRQLPRESDLQDPQIDQTALFEVIDEDTKVSRIVNFTFVSHVGSLVVWKHRSIKCGMGPIVTKVIVDWDVQSEEPRKKRVEIKVSPKLHRLIAEEHCNDAATEDFGEDMTTLENDLKNYSQVDIGFSKNFTGSISSTEHKITSFAPRSELPDSLEMITLTNPLTTKQVIKSHLKDVDHVDIELAKHFIGSMSPDESTIITLKRKKSKSRDLINMATAKSDLRVDDQIDLEFSKDFIDSTNSKIQILDNPTTTEKFLKVDTEDKSQEDLQGFSQVRNFFTIKILENMTKVPKEDKTTFESTITTKKFFNFAAGKKHQEDIHLSEGSSTSTIFNRSEAATFERQSSQISDSFTTTALKHLLTTKKTDVEHENLEDLYLLQGITDLLSSDETKAKSFELPNSQTSDSFDIVNLESTKKILEKDMTSLETKMTGNKVKKIDTEKENRENERLLPGFDRSTTSVGSSRITLKPQNLEELKTPDFIVMTTSKISLPTETIFKFDKKEVTEGGTRIPHSFNSSISSKIVTLTLKNPKTTDLFTSIPNNIVEINKEHKIQKGTYISDDRTSSISPEIVSLDAAETKVKKPCGHEEHPEKMNGNWSERHCEINGLCSCNDKERYKQKASLTATSMVTSSDKDSSEKTDSTGVSLESNVSLRKSNIKSKETSSVPGKGITRNLSIPKDNIRETSTIEGENIEGIMTIAEENIIKTGDIRGQTFKEISTKKEEIVEEISTTSEMEFEDISVIQEETLQTRKPTTKLERNSTSLEMIKSPTKLMQEGSEFTDRLSSISTVTLTSSENISEPINISVSTIFIEESPSTPNVYKAKVIFEAAKETSKGFSTISIEEKSEFPHKTFLSPKTYEITSLFEENKETAGMPLPKFIQNKSESTYQTSLMPKNDKITVEFIDTKETSKMSSTQVIEKESEFPYIMVSGPKSLEGTTQFEETTEITATITTKMVETQSTFSEDTFSYEESISMENPTTSQILTRKDESEDVILRAIEPVSNVDNFSCDKGCSSTTNVHPCNSSEFGVEVNTLKSIESNRINETLWWTLLKTTLKPENGENKSVKNKYGVFSSTLNATSWKSNLTETLEFENLENYSMTNIADVSLSVANEITENTMLKMTAIHEELKNHSIMTEETLSTLTSVPTPWTAISASILPFEDVQNVSIITSILTDPWTTLSTSTESLQDVENISTISLITTTPWSAPIFQLQTSENLSITTSTRISPSVTMQTSWPTVSPPTLQSQESQNTSVIVSTTTKPWTTLSKPYLQPQDSENVFSTTSTYNFQPISAQTYWTTLSTQTLQPQELKRSTIISTTTRPLMILSTLFLKSRDSKKQPISLSNFPTTAETHKSIPLTPLPSSISGHKLTLRINVLLEHVNEKLEKQTLVELQKDIPIEERPRSHDDLMEELMVLNKTINSRMMKMLFNCTKIGQMMKYDDISLNSSNKSSRSEDQDKKSEEINLHTRYLNSEVFDECEEDDFYEKTRTNNDTDYLLIPTENYLYIKKEKMNVRGVTQDSLEVKEKKNAGSNINNGEDISRHKRYSVNEITERQVMNDVKKYSLEDNKGDRSNVRDNKDDYLNKIYILDGNRNKKVVTDVSENLLTSKTHSLHGTEAREYIRQDHLKPKRYNTSKTQRRKAAGRIKRNISRIKERRNKRRNVGDVEKQSLKFRRYNFNRRDGRKTVEVVKQMPLGAERWKNKINDIKNDEEHILQPRNYNVENNQENCLRCEKNNFYRKEEKIIITGIVDDSLGTEERRNKETAFENMKDVPALKRYGLCKRNKRDVAEYTAKKKRKNVEEGLERDNLFRKSEIKTKASKMYTTDKIKKIKIYLENKGNIVKNKLENLTEISKIQDEEHNFDQLKKINKPSTDLRNETITTHIEKLQKENLAKSSKKKDKKLKPEVIKKGLLGIQKDVLSGLKHIASQLEGNNLKISSKMFVWNSIENLVENNSYARRKRYSEKKLGYWMNKKILYANDGDKLRSFTEFTLYKLVP